MSKSNQIQLSDHFTTGRLLKFTASPIIMMIFTSIYTIVDGFFVSNYAGKTAFTALNLIYPYLQMLGCLGFMIGTGGSALVAMTLGTGDENRANRLFSERNPNPGWIASAPDTSVALMIFCIFR